MESRAWADIRDFGAMFAGGDATTAYQEAVTALIALDEEAIVYFPPGNWIIRDALVPATITIIAQGPGHMHIKGAMVDGDREWPFAEAVSVLELMPSRRITAWFRPAPYNPRPQCTSAAMGRGVEID